MERKKINLPNGTLVPNHLAIICDGNRRWARARGKPAFEGHRRGFDITPAIARACRDFGIHTLTFWVFSTENWDRPKEEIAFLMKKYEEFVDLHLSEARKEMVKIVHLGRKDRIPVSLAKKIIKAEEQTKSNKKYILNIALDYGGRDEILRATKRIITGGLEPEKLDEESYKNYLDTRSQPYPYPDLLIRPSGEQRTSGMFAWQGAYTETYWLPDHFPELTPEKLKEAIIDFSKRRRRFGGNDYVPKVKFEPRKLAKLETGWWKAHNKKDNEKLGAFLKEWLKELYGLNPREAGEAVKFLTEGVGFHNKKDWQRAEEKISRFYRFIKEKTGYVFAPETAAQLEVSWWRIHDELEDNLDKSKLEKAFRDYYGEIYRLSDLQAGRTAHFKTLATQAHDLAEKPELIKKSEEYWRLAEEYLFKAYQALREVAS